MKKKLLKALTRGDRATIFIGTTASAWYQTSYPLKILVLLIVYISRILGLNLVFSITSLQHFFSFTENRDYLRFSYILSIQAKVFLKHTMDSMSTQPII